MSLDFKVYTLAEAKAAGGWFLDDVGDRVFFSHVPGRAPIVVGADSAFVFDYGDVEYYESWTFTRASNLESV